VAHHQACQSSHPDCCTALLKKARHLLKVCQADSCSRQCKAADPALQPQSSPAALQLPLLQFAARTRTAHRYLTALPSEQTGMTGPINYCIQCRLHDSICCLQHNHTVTAPSLPPLPLPPGLHLRRPLAPPLFVGFCPAVQLLRTCWAQVVAPAHRQQRHSGQMAHHQLCRAVIQASGRTRPSSASSLSGSQLQQAVCDC